MYYIVGFCHLLFWEWGRRMRLRRPLILPYKFGIFLNYYKESVVTFCNNRKYCICWVVCVCFLRTGCTTNAITSTIFLSSHPGMCSLALPRNSRCSPSSKEEMKLECKCLPNYKGDGKYCDVSRTSILQVYSLRWLDSYQKKLTAFLILTQWTLLFLSV